jgi:hypothetical protein
MFTIEPKKTRTKFTIAIAKKTDRKRHARFAKELQALLRKYDVKATRKKRRKKR